jgi:hypothetical protein
MRNKVRAAAMAAMLVSTSLVGVAVSPQAASAGVAGCCYESGERWFSGPTQSADCLAAGQALAQQWDSWRCSPVGDRTRLSFWRIIS